MTFLSLSKDYNTLVTYLPQRCFKWDYVYEEYKPKVSHKIEE